MAGGWQGGGTGVARGGMGLAGEWQGVARRGSSGSGRGGWVMTCRSRYPAICSRKLSSTSADQVRARRMPTGDALDSRGWGAAAAPTTPHAKSVAAALLAPGAPLTCRPGDAALRGSEEPGSAEPAGSEAAIDAMPLKPRSCSSSFKGEEEGEEGGCVLVAPSRLSGLLEGLDLPLSFRSGSAAC